MNTTLAPNQWWYGRPRLSEIWSRLSNVEKRQDVAWVRVQLHEDTVIEKSGEGIICEVAGDAIAICTTAADKDIEQAVDTESLCSDGVIEGWVNLPDSFADIPVIPQGYRVLSVVWD